MKINWYPGHMTKSIRMIEDSIKHIDVVIYVLDARAVKSCINPDFERVVANKPVIYVINKTDLADPKVTEGWVKKLATGGRAAVTMTASVPKSAAVLSPLVKRMCGEKLEKYKARGVSAVIRGMVIGVPNCGKSTLINSLCGYAKTVTGNRAGVTRGKQWVKISDYFEIMDTPGTLYPKLADQETARNLAFIGSIRDEVVDTFELALELTVKLGAGGYLKSRYNVEWDENPENALLGIAKSRGYMLKGGEADIERAATALIDDFRKARIGKISLDAPNA